MTGQIPPYGKYFRRERLPWSPDWAGRRYTLKVDERYYIISNHNSERWYVFFNGVQVKGPLPHMRDAMRYLMPVDAPPLTGRKIKVTEQAREMNARNQETKQRVRAWYRSNYERFTAQNYWHGSDV